MIPILFLAADPTDVSRLRLGEEAREILENLQRAKLRDSFEFQQRTSVRPTDISQALLDTNPQIVHFSGHGTSSGAIYVEDKLGQTHPIQADALSALFEQFKASVHCVLLNACYSEIQANAIAQHIDYVIGMNQAIGDKAAIAFSIGFYQAIGAGRSLEDAYKLGCVQIRLHNIPEDLTPVLIKNARNHDKEGMAVSTIQGHYPQVSSTKQHEIKVNLPGLLKMLGSNIYAEPDMAVREIIQNAHDTCIIRQAKEVGFTTPQIYISYDCTARTLAFTDNGAGMTENELHEYLSTIGRGFTQVQREDLHDINAQKLIGQFGIGMLSAFSVGNKVEIFTCSYLNDAQGFRWVCEGDIHYTVEPIKKVEVGTRLILYLNDKGLVLLESEGNRLKQIIKKYADFLSIPIVLENHGQVNSIMPPWQRGQQVNLEKYLFDRYGLHAIEIIPIDCHQPVHVEGLLFIPMASLEIMGDFGEVDVYIKCMFITAKNKELLPTWARFIKGIINSSALTPTLDRNSLIKDEAYDQVHEILGEVILNHLEGLSQTNVGMEKLNLIVSAYNNVIKSSSLHDEAFFRRIAPLLRVQVESEKMTMSQYLSNSNDIIYYISESGSLAQHKLLFAKKNIPVIDASWGIEEEILKKYARIFGKQIRRLDTEADSLFDNSAEIDEKWRDLEKQFEMVVGVKAQAVSFDPSSIPVILEEKSWMEDELPSQSHTLGQQVGLSANQLRQAFAQMRQSKAGQEQWLLRLNVKNQLMQNLRDMKHNDTFKLALKVIYHNAYILARQYIEPDDLENIVTCNNEAFATMVRYAHRVEELERKIAQTEVKLD